ncbi:AAA family ATPase [Campylobacter ureolyticus]|uniref:AAA family ATPase n=1 Tax=Campylobacter ureolyticus TaxID=827 RepID=UPI001FC89149|nr:AAA family ATPase [Campylobacter ureolyticus]MCZ6104877.1 AAA family ATPase [Campylobacter ureolyticus]MCZ6157492.1 AAA family ATPase [Campylobacter ureolyticus]GKH60110.1 hypothetical protein CE91St25_04460 [Campylobacter ureolyticus]
MIIGILLKNFKVYSGLNYIPISTKYNFSAYIGDNGIGKSSILEALDTYFNDRPWNIAKSSSTTGANTPHITLVHLIEKEKMSFYLNSSKNKDEVWEDMERISDYA